MGGVECGGYNKKYITDGGESGGERFANAGERARVCAYRAEAEWELADEIDRPNK
jgi:hypothetical protein